LKVLHEKVLAYSCHFTYQLNLKKKEEETNVRMVCHMFNLLLVCKFNYGSHYPGIFVNLLIHPVSLVVSSFILVGMGCVQFAVIIVHSLLLSLQQTS